MKFVRDCFLFLICLLLSSCSPEISTPTATIIQTPSLAGTHVVPSDAAPTTAPTVSITPESGTSFSLDMVTSLDPILKAALQKHAGLEASITPEANGQFTANVTVLTSEGQPTTAQKAVTPETLTQDLTSKNKYGDTPVMMLADGSKLYWIQEEKAWFEVKISPDINKPVLIPYDKTEIATRVTIAEFPQPFSQKAVDWWNNSPQIEVGFQYLQTNANTGASTKFAYLRNDAMGVSSRTVEESPVQLINAWFAMDFPDGTQYEFFPTKWLDPMDPRNPNGDEWKIINVASGPEVMGNKSARDKYYQLFTSASTKPRSRLEITPIVAAQDEFFDGTNNLFTLGVAQPSLNKLAKQVNGIFGNFSLPNNPNVRFRYWIDKIFNDLSASSATLSLRFQNKTEADYKTNFWPADIQTLIIPSLIVIR